MNTQHRQKVNQILNEILGSSSHAAEHAEEQKQTIQILEQSSITIRYPIRFLRFWIWLRGKLGTNDLHLRDEGILLYRDVGYHKRTRPDLLYCRFIESHQGSARDGSDWEWWETHCYRWSIVTERDYPAAHFDMLVNSTAQAVLKFEDKHFPATRVGMKALRSALASKDLSL